MLTISNDNSVKYLLPPFVNTFLMVVLSQCKLPAILSCAIRGPAEIFDGGIENQQILHIMQMIVLLEVFSWNMVWYKWAVRKPLVRERHRYLRNSSSVLRQTPSWEGLARSAYVRDSYIGVEWCLSFPSGGSCRGRLSGILEGGSNTGGRAPGLILDPDVSSLSYSLEFEKAVNESSRIDSFNVPKATRCFSPLKDLNLIETPFRFQRGSRSGP
jgi:hypothetical protein